MCTVYGQFTPSYFSMLADLSDQCAYHCKQAAGYESKKWFFLDKRWPVVNDFRFLISDCAKLL